MACEADSVSTIERTVSYLLSALEQDAINPKPDYSIDGQTVSRAQWRSNLLQQVKGLQEIAQFLEPFELRGNAI